MIGKLPIEDLDKRNLKLVKLAMNVRKKAYAPYSKYKVGCIIVDDKGGVHSGCNVENAAYPSAICAERAAIFKMVSRGRKAIRKIIVITSSDEPVFPCGGCLQVIEEFGRGAEVIAVNQRATLFSKCEVHDLFPSAFTPEKLKG